MTNTQKSGVDASNHTNPPEILALRRSQRAARAPLPVTTGQPARKTPEARKAGTVRLSGQNTSHTRLLLTVQEVAERLGIGRTAVFELVRIGQLRSVKVGRNRRIPTDWLEEFVNQLKAEAA